jgi:preprotein translocase subunit SecA
MTLRQKIKKYILSHVKKNPNETLTYILDQIKSYYGAEKEMDKFKITRQEILQKEDNEKFIDQMNKYITGYNTDINILLKDIDSAFYNFDQIQINKLKQLTGDKLKNTLKSYATRIVNVVTEAELKRILNKPDEEFPNMFISCQDKHKIIYCKRNKLVMTRDKLTELLDILAADIHNPIKEKWLFSMLFVENIMSYFRFERRPFEKISILV